jgi:glycosyltransferase involved in cell wall biosynthesis
LAIPRARSPAPRVAFVYPNPRRELAQAVAAGRLPDTTLLGQNHLGPLGVEATIHDLPAPRGGPLLRQATWNLRELAVPWQLRDVDVVVTPLPGLLPLASRSRPRLRVVLLNYGLSTMWSRAGQARRRLLLASLRSAAVIVCLGSAQRDLLVDQTGLAPGRVVTAKLGVDERYFAPRRQAPRDGAPLVFSVGKDLARDYATLVDAIAPLDVRLELACLPRNLAGVAVPAHVGARFVDPPALRDLYAEAACVVLPQRSAGYPYGTEAGGLTALLEAMAMGLPVVATERPVLRDYIEHCKTALIVPPEQPEALRDAVVRVLEDRTLASSLGAAARTAVERNFTTLRFAEQLAPILRAAPKTRRNQPQ